MTTLKFEQENMRKKVRAKGTESAASDYDRDAVLPVDRSKMRKQSRKNVLPANKRKKLILDLLNLVARCELSRRPMPDINEQLRQELEPAVVGAGGLLKWAQRQPDYAKIRKHQEKELARELGASVTKSVSRRADELGPDILSSLDGLAAVQRELRQLLSGAERQLDRLGQEIARLRQLAEPAGNDKRD